MKNAMFLFAVFIIFICLSSCFGRENIASNQNSITDFFFYEIMESNRDWGFHRDEFMVLEFFGTPNEIRVLPVEPFGMQGGTVIEIHEYVYDDFTHHYYIFAEGAVFYIGFIIENRLERLETINIGDTSEKLLSIFSDRFFTWETPELKTISFYTDPVICEIRFIIRNGIIERIFINFFLA